MVNFLTKFIFLLRKPKVIIVTGEARVSITKAIYQVLRPHFKIEKLVDKTPNILSVFKKEVFLIETGLKSSRFSKKLNYWIKLSQLPILIVSRIDDRTKEAQELAKMIPVYGFLILNFDDERIREINNIKSLKTLTFGFQEGADFKASDIHINTGINFKINYKGNIIPVWLKKTSTSGGEQIYSALAANSVGIIFGLNFIEISEALKNYR